AVAVAALLSARAAAQAPADVLAGDEKTLRDVGVAVDGPSLLNYFRTRTHAEANPGRVADLIRRLGADDFATRERAQAELQELGPGALAGLRRAEHSPDAEVRSRVAGLRRRVEEKANAAVQLATARLVAARRPAGAAAVLLA